jgi:hypothetical protein
MRDATEANQIAVKSDVIAPMYLVYLETGDDQDIYVASTPFDIEYNGNTFIGVGTLGKIGDITEGIEIQSYTLQLILSGVPTSMVNEAMETEMQGKVCKVWMGILNDDGALVSDPVLMFRGKTDTLEIEIGDTATITLKAESRLVDWERARTELYTDASQKKKWPDDRGLEFVEQSAQAEIIWGQR